MTVFPMIGGGPGCWYLVIFNHHFLYLIDLYFSELNEAKHQKHLDSSIGVMQQSSLEFHHSLNLILSIIQVTKTYSNQVSANETTALFTVIKQRCIFFMRESVCLSSFFTMILQCLKESGVTFYFFVHIAGLFINFMMFSGYLKSSGLIFVQLLHKFNAPTSHTSLLFTIRAAFFSVFGELLLHYSTLCPIWGEYQIQSVSLSVCVYVSVCLCVSVSR